MYKDGYYYVLSNDDLKSILIYGLVFGLFLGQYVFGFLAERDASSNQQKEGILVKFLPWLAICILLGETALFINRCIDYPWHHNPIPLNESIIQDIRYHISGSIIWGWANDEQLPILNSLSRCVLWICWGMYAFKFKPSKTSWWKKSIKVIAYFLLSILILGFHYHQLRDFIVIFGFVAVISFLLWLAKVRPTK